MCGRFMPSSSLTLATASFCRALYRSCVKTFAISWLPWRTGRASGAARRLEHSYSASEAGAVIHLPQGFVFSACAAGLKASGKPDLAFALAPEGASAAAMFTRNQVAAAPVVVGREHLRVCKGRIHALIVNAGNANCATGTPGLKEAKTVCREVASE